MMAFDLVGAVIGMLVVETIAKIRRAYFQQGKAIKAICRELGVSRKVVRKVIRTNATEFTYEREHQPLPKIGPWQEQLDELLTANASRSTQERLTLIRIYEELRGRGYVGGYDAIRRYARGWSKEHAASAADAYVPLTFAPGEAYQFDWSHEIVLIAGFEGRPFAEGEVRRDNDRGALVETADQIEQELTARLSKGR